MQGINMSALHSVKNMAFTLLIFLALTGCEEKATTDSLAPLIANPSTKNAKPGASIWLRSTSPLYITPYDLVHTDIFLETSESSGELTIHFSPSEGLTLKNMDSQQFIKLDGSGSIKIPLSLHTTSVGRYYLNMHITVNNADTVSVRNIAVIVQAGAILEKNIKLEKVTGENIIRLPTKETISGE